MVWLLLAHQFHHKTLTYPDTGVSELKRISETLQSEVDCVSSLLVRLLHVKDKRATRASRQCERLSAILKDYASKNGKKQSIL